MEAVTHEATIHEVQTNSDMLSDTIVLQSPAMAPATASTNVTNAPANSGSGNGTSTVQSSCAAQHHNLKRLMLSSTSSNPPG